MIGSITFLVWGMVSAAGLSIVSLVIMFTSIILFEEFYPNTVAMGWGQWGKEID